MANYCDPSELKKHVEEFQASGTMSEAFALVLRRIGMHVAHTFLPPRFKCESEDYANLLVLKVLKNRDKLKPEKNLFALFTHIVRMEVYHFLRRPQHAFAGIWLFSDCGSEGMTP